MASITKSKVIDYCRDTLGLQNKEVLPNSVSNIVVPTFELNKQNANIVRGLVKTNTGATAIYATPVNQDFYITHASLDWQTDAANDGTSAYIQVTINGVSSGMYVLSLGKLTLTAISKSLSIAFANPIKIDRNTNVQVVTAFTVGTSVCAATLSGYLVD